MDGCPSDNDLKRGEMSNEKREVDGKALQAAYGLLWGDPLPWWAEGEPLSPKEIERAVRLLEGRTEPEPPISPEALERAFELFG